MGIQRADSMEHVAQVKQFVDNYIPNGYGIREKMLSGRPGDEIANISDEFLRKAILDETKLPVVHGHLIEENLNWTSKLNARTMTNFLFKWLATKPEDAWARHPLFIDLYRKSIGDRIATA